MYDVDNANLSNKPKVSVAVPVYNGAQWLAQTLDSILSQTFEDFELVISDNASTDDTVRICEEYAAADDRIVLHQNEHNIGAALNFNVAFKLARGSYFKWASSNDLIGPTFLQQCVDVLDEQPDVVAACPRTQLIDADGSIIEKCTEDMHLMADCAYARFAAFLERVRYNNIEQSLIRRDVLNKTTLQKVYPNSDTVLMAEIAARGKIYQVPEFLLSRRIDKSSATQFMTYDQIKKQYFSGAYIPNRTIGMTRGLLALASRLSLPLSEKWRFYKFAFRYLVWSRDELFRDLGSFCRECDPSAPTSSRRLLSDRP